MTWLIGLLSSSQQRDIGERLWPTGYHLYLCSCCDNGDDSLDETA